MTPNPTLELVGPEFFRILNFPLFIDVAKQIFESPNICANGIFHCRPDLPHQPSTDTPWHQDAQCCPSLVGTKFMIMWMPLMDVDETNGCLEAAPGRQHNGKVYPVYQDPTGYYISMKPQDAAGLKDCHTLRMKKGDLLFFNELSPHRAVPNYSDSIRWSIDLRYHESENHCVVASNRSIICAHEDLSKIEYSYDNWVKKMHRPIDIPVGRPTK